MPWRRVVASTALVSLVALVSCGGDIRTVRGLVVDVQSYSLVDLDSLDVSDLEGRRWHFQARGFKGAFTPSHLRQHMVLGDSLTVSYREEDGVFIIDDITD